MQIQQRQLGSKGPEVFPLALGCSSMSGTGRGSGDKESIATIQEAIANGVNLIEPLVGGAFLD